MVETTDYQVTWDDIDIYLSSGEIAEVIAQIDDIDVTVELINLINKGAAPRLKGAIVEHCQQNDEFYILEEATNDRTHRHKTRED